MTGIERRVLLVSGVLLAASLIFLTGWTQGFEVGCNEIHTDFRYSGDASIDESGDVIINTEAPYSGERDAVVYVRLGNYTRQTPYKSDRRFVIAWNKIAEQKPGVGNPNLDVNATLEAEQVLFDIDPKDTVTLTYIGEPLERPLRCDMFVRTVIYKGQIGQPGKSD